MVDAIVLLALIHEFTLNAILARVFSFGIAVSFTFELNRRWVFGAREQHLVAAFTSYLGVQCAGFLCNLGVYTLTILAMPPPYNTPLLSLVVASGFALMVNYTGAKHLVFGTNPRVRDSIVEPWSAWGAREINLVVFDFGCRASADVLAQIFPAIRGALASVAIFAGLAVIGRAIRKDGEFEP